MSGISRYGQMISQRLDSLQLRSVLLIQWFSFGLVVGLFLRYPSSLGWWWIVIGGGMALVLSKSRVWLVVVGVCLIGVGVGQWRAQTYWAEFDIYRSNVETVVTIRGKLAEDGIYNERGQRQLLLDDIYFVDQEVSAPGRVQVTTFSEARYRRGDVVEVSGTLRERFGNRAGYMYFATVTEIARSDSPVESTRRGFFAGVFTALKSPEDSLGLGFLLGTRALLPDTLNEQLAITGLTHIVAVSGYNLTVLIRICRRLLAPISAFLAVAGSVALVIGFVIMTGLVPSIFRASVVAALALAAWYYGRRTSPWTLLLVSAAVTAVIKPEFLWFDLGWWLSFLAFIGVLVIAPLVTARLFNEREPPLLVQIAIETSCAQLMALPLIGMVFGQISLISVMANVLVLPLIPLAMALVAVAGLGGMIIPQFVGWLAWPAQLLLELITSLVALMAKVPRALVEVNYLWPTMALLYGLITAGFLVLRQQASRQQLETARDYNIID